MPTQCRTEKIRRGKRDWKEKTPLEGAGTVHTPEFIRCTVGRCKLNLYELAFGHAGNKGFGFPSIMNTIQYQVSTAHMSQMLLRMSLHEPAQSRHRLLQCAPICMCGSTT